MATAPITSKYFVANPGADNLDFIDFDLAYGSITTVGASVFYSGTAQVDSVFVRPGLTYDLSTGNNVDKVYLTGSLSDYRVDLNSANSTMTLSRTVNGQTETIILSNGNPNVTGDDTLVFADGQVKNYALFTATAGGTKLPTPDPIESSLKPQGAANPTGTLNATIRAFSSNGADEGKVAETFAVVRPGIEYFVTGGNGIDTVYVGDGEVVDATALGKSTDLVYMRGKWSDYSKTTESNGTVLVFTRPVNGVTEKVSVLAGTPNLFDRLIFADGSVSSYQAKVAILTSPVPAFDSLPTYNSQQVTPLYSDKQVAAALATIRDAAKANNATASQPGLDVYTTAGIKGVTSANLGSINDALNSAAITGLQADTAPEVQAIVNAYNAILTSADGIGHATTPLTAAQYAAIGVTGVSAASGTGTALNLLDDVVDRSLTTAVDSVGKVQAMADAAAHVIAAGNGTPAEAAALSLADLLALGITGVSASNLAAVQAKIQSTADGLLDTRGELQGVVNAATRDPRRCVNSRRRQQAGGVVLLRRRAQGVERRLQRAGANALARTQAVGVADVDRDQLADIGGGHRVGAGRRAADGNAVAQPGVAQSAQAVGIGDGAGIGRQRLPRQQAAADRRKPGRRVVQDGRADDLYRLINQQLRIVALVIDRVGMAVVDGRLLGVYKTATRHHLVGAAAVNQQLVTRLHGSEVVRAARHVAAVKDIHARHVDHVLQTQAQGVGGCVGGQVDSLYAVDA
ncbi:MAG: hypothetical protein HXX19_12940 [Rhodoferax sp.]|nr:hypothetical protein [Rhodoferax sp.]